MYANTKTFNVVAVDIMQFVFRIYLTVSIYTTFISGLMTTSGSGAHDEHLTQTVFTFFHEYQFPRGEEKTIRRSTATVAHLDFSCG